MWITAAVLGAVTMVAVQLINEEQPDAYIVGLHARGGHRQTHLNQTQYTYKHSARQTHDMTDGRLGGGALVTGLYSM